MTVSEERFRDTDENLLLATHLDKSSMRYTSEAKSMAADKLSVLLQRRSVPASANTEYSNQTCSINTNCLKRR